MSTPATHYETIQEAKTLDEACRRLFEIVYQWGRVGIVADAHSATYQQLVKDIIESADDSTTHSDDFEEERVCPAGHIYLPTDTDAYAHQKGCNCNES